MNGKREYLHMEADIRVLLSRTRNVSDLEIRDAAAQDAITLGKLYAGAYFELMDQLPPPRSETLEDFTRTMIELFIKAFKEPQKDIFKWIAEYFGCPVGFLITKVIGDRGYVGEIGVVPSYRRKGIAQTLLNRFAIFLKDREVYTVGLDVNIKNTSARELYSFCGFKKTHTWLSQ